VWPSIKFKPKLTYLYLLKLNCLYLRIKLFHILVQIENVLIFLNKVFDSSKFNVTISDLFAANQASHLANYGL